MTAFILIFFLLLVAYWWLIDYYRRKWNSIPTFMASREADIQVSVVVAVRNEAQYLASLMECLSLQDYPKNRWELIVVDDHSTDATADVFRQYHSPGARYLFLDLPPELMSKKAAIAHGVHRANGELIITTDGDCEMDARWISTMAAFYASTGAKFIAAPVLLRPRKNFLGVFQSLDFFALQGITGASVASGLHCMCNGANLGYAKAAFIDVNGFEGIDAIPSGDDMLLMYKVFKRYPRDVHFLKSQEAIVTTAGERSWKDFFQQRIRWASKAVHYQDKRIRYILWLTYLVNLCFLALAVAAMFHASWLTFLLLFILAKTIIEFPFVNAVSLFFGPSEVMIYFPLMQPFHIFYTIIAGWLGRFGSYTWKSRKIKNN